MINLPKLHGFNKPQCRINFPEEQVLLDKVIWLEHGVASCDPTRSQVQIKNHFGILILICMQEKYEHMGSRHQSSDVCAALVLGL